MSFASMISVLFIILLIPLTGIILAITPWLMRRNECFAVTIPAAKQNDERLVALKRRYAKSVLVLTAAFTLIAAAALFFMMRQPGGVSEAALAVIVLTGVLAPIVLSFALMLRSRREVQAIKASEGWFAASQQVVAVVAEEDIPNAVSLAWNLLYIPIVLASLALAYALYPSMPDEIPMHMGFSGEIDSTASKWPTVFAFPLLLSVFMGLTMAFCHWTILRSKRPTDLGAPVTSAFAYGMFARAQSILLVITGLGLTAGLDFSFVLTAAGVLSMHQMLGVVLALSFVVVMAAIGVSVVYGQAGSRLHARMVSDDLAVSLGFDDDEHWILGIFYFNRDDASLFLPERFGIGWTINLARPAAWMIFGGLIVLTIVFCVAMSTLS